jgi:hypothetical protein
VICFESSHRGTTLTFADSEPRPVGVRLAHVTPEVRRASTRISSDNFRQQRETLLDGLAKRSARLQR